MGTIVQHIQRAPSGLLYYRRALPAVLQPFIPRSPGQVRRSLGSASISAPGAMERYQRAAAEFERLTATARKAMAGIVDQLDDATIAYLVRVFQRQMHEGARASYRGGSGNLDSGMSGLPA